MAELIMHPIASSSNTRKPKKHKEKSRQHRASLPDADAHPGTAVATTPPCTETDSLTVPPAPAPVPTSADTAPTPAVVVEARKDGLVPADWDVEFGDFDFDAVNAEEGAELWLVRAPSSVRRTVLLCSCFLTKHTAGARKHHPFFSIRCIQKKCHSFESFFFALSLF